jgi:hypothetical protein
MASLDARVDALFADLSDDPEQRLEAVARIYSVIRDRAAQHLQPAIREILRHSHDLNYEQKVQTCHRINHVLQDARLAIADPVTDLPSAIIANRPRPASHASRFYLRDNRNAADGKRHSILLKEHDASAIQVVAVRPEEHRSRGR